MLVAPAKPPEPAWTPVMGAEVLFEPITRGMLIRARRAARAASQAEAPDGATPLTSIDMLEEMGDALSRALITEGAKDWRAVAVQQFADGEPVLDADEQPVFEPLPFSAENLALVLSDPVTFEAFDAAYVVPFMLKERERAEPGNGSAASPSGTGEAATQGNATATSPAKRQTGGGARRASTSSKSRATKPKKTSGGS